MEKDNNKIVDKCCCYVCGDEGYKDLLIDCVQCSELHIHKYCLGMKPGSLEDKQGIDWLCYYCKDQTSVLKSKSLVLVKEQPEPLCTLFPKGYILKSKSKREEPVEIVRGVVLLVSPSGVTRMMYDDPSILEYFPGFGSLARFVSKDVVKTKVSRMKRKRELEKLDFVGCRRSPRFTRRKLMHKSNAVVAAY